MAKYTQEQLEQIAEMQDQVYADDELGPEYESLIARKFPQHKGLPGLSRGRARDTVRSELAKERESLTKERDEWRKEREEEKKAAATERNASLLSQRRQRLTEGFTAPDGSFVTIEEKDIPAVEKYMMDEGLASHEIAAFAWEAARRVAQPRTQPHGGRIAGAIYGPAGDDFKWLEPGIKGDMTALDQATRAKAEEVWRAVTTPGPQRDALLRGM